MLYLWKYLD